MLEAKNRDTFAFQSLTRNIVPKNRILCNFFDLMQPFHDFFENFKTAQIGPNNLNMRSVKFILLINNFRIFFYKFFQVTYCEKTFEKKLKKFTVYTSSKNLRSPRDIFHFYKMNKIGFLWLYEVPLSDCLTSARSWLNAKLNSIFPTIMVFEIVTSFNIRIIYHRSFADLNF